MPLQLDIDKDWFEKMAAKEGNLEIGAGRRFPPAYDNCQCRCHRSPLVHIIACCHPSKEDLQAIRRCLEMTMASVRADDRLD